MKYYLNIRSPHWAPSTSKPLSVLSKGYYYFEFGCIYSVPAIDMGEEEKSHSKSV